MLRLCKPPLSYESPLLTQSQAVMANCASAPVVFAGGAERQQCFASFDVDRTEYFYRKVYLDSS